MKTINISAKAQVKRNRELQLEANLRAELRCRARTNLLPFIKYTKPDYQISWHHIIMCHYLDKFMKGEIQYLLFTAPPRHGKSEIVSRRLPAFAFGLDPNLNFIGSSYTADLARMMNRDVQRIIDTDGYADIFPETKLSGSNVRSTAHGNYLRNSDVFEIVGHSGMYKAAGVGGGITGFGSNIGSIDDPIKNFEEANSITHRNKAWEWYKSTFYTRLEERAQVLMTLTRWHEDDLAGRVIKLMKENADADQWVILNFPATMDKKLKYLAPEDKRKNGEALWPGKYDEPRLKKIRATVGSYIYGALYQGTPAAIGGTLFKSKHFRYYALDETGLKFVCERPGKEPVSILRKSLVRYMYADPALEEKTSDDPTGMGAWGYSKKYKIWLLLDRVHERIPQTEQQERMVNFASKNSCILVGVENEKLGKVLVKASAGKDKTKGGQSIPFKEVPTRNLDKFSRAVPMATYIENERVFFPKEAPWLAEYESNLVGFPRAKHDEDVDITSMAAEMEGKTTVTEGLAMMRG